MSEKQQESKKNLASAQKQEQLELLERFVGILEKEKKTALIEAETNKAKVSSNNQIALRSIDADEAILLDSREKAVKQSRDTKLLVFAVSFIVIVFFIILVIYGKNETLEKIIFAVFGAGGGSGLTFLWMNAKSQSNKE